jgi:hypothetical protein
VADRAPVQVKAPGGLLEAAGAGMDQGAIPLEELVGCELTVAEAPPEVCVRITRHVIKWVVSAADEDVAGALL